MDDIANILKKSAFKKPDEIEIVKSYILEKYSKKVSVSVRQEAMIISSGSASFINDLRLNAKMLAESCDLADKKIIFRIS
jgi:hypothetical protein